MKRNLSLGILSALALVGAGCAANPLVGDWRNPQSCGGVEITSTLHLGADGTAMITLAGSGGCTGMQTYQGTTWTSSATTITLSGTPSCSGMIMCTIGGTTVNIDCSQTMNSTMTGACSYTLSNENNTLTTSACAGSTGGGATSFTRVTGS